MNVLIINHDESSVRMLVRLVEVIGYQPIVTESCEQATSLVEQNQIDCAVFDWHCEGDSGMQMIAPLRRAQPDLPIIMSRAATSIDGQVEVHRNSAVTLVAKPITLEGLREAFEQTQVLLAVQQV